MYTACKVVSECKYLIACCMQINSAAWRVLFEVPSMKITASTCADILNHYCQKHYKFWRISGIVCSPVGVTHTHTILYSSTVQLHGSWHVYATYAGVWPWQLNWNTENQPTATESFWYIEFTFAFTCALAKLIARYNATYKLD